MTNRYTTDEDEITDVFPPLCPECGNPTIWQSDNMLSECAYISEEDGDEFDDDRQDDAIVHTFFCPECGATLEYEDLEEEGKMVLLCISDDLSCQYTKYAQRTYGMPANVG